MLSCYAIHQLSTSTNYVMFSANSFLEPGSWVVILRLSSTQIWATVVVYTDLGHAKVESFCTEADKSQDCNEKCV